jgi:cytidylate kinase
LSSPASPTYSESTSQRRRKSDPSGYRHRLGSIEKAAVRSIRGSDRSRTDYLSRFYAIENEQPTHYDVVLTTDRLKITDAADLVARAASLKS